MMVQFFQCGVCHELFSQIKPFFKHFVSHKEYLRMPNIHTCKENEKIFICKKKEEIFETTVSEPVIPVALEKQWSTELRTNNGQGKMTFISIDKGKVAVNEHKQNSDEDAHSNVIKHHTKQLVKTQQEHKLANNIVHVQTIQEMNHKSQLPRSIPDDECQSELDHNVVMESGWAEKDLLEQELSNDETGDKYEIIDNDNSTYLSLHAYTCSACEQEFPSICLLHSHLDDQSYYFNKATQTCTPQNLSCCLTQSSSGGLSFAQTYYNRNMDDNGESLESDITKLTTTASDITDCHYIVTREVNDVVGLHRDNCMNGDNEDFDISLVDGFGFNEGNDEISSSNQLNSYSSKSGNAQSEKKDKCTFKEEIEHNKDIEIKTLKRKRGRPKKIKNVENGELNIVGDEHIFGNTRNCKMNSKVITTTKNLTKCAIKQDLGQIEDNESNGRNNGQTEEIIDLKFDPNNVSHFKDTMVCYSEQWNKVLIKTESVDEIVSTNYQGQLALTEVKCRESRKTKKEQKQKRAGELLKLHPSGPNIKIPCSNCGRVFYQKNMSHHTKVCTSNRPFACQLCPSMFVAKGNLHSHMKSVHLRTNRYQCEECGERFFVPSKLAKHKRNHTGERNYQCSVCDRSFMHIEYLRKHEKLHTGKKDQICSTCGKMFYTTWNLHQHELTHSAVGQYVCRTCQKSFNTKRSLKRHEETQNCGH